jgi:hypothetical protein
MHVGVEVCSGCSMGMVFGACARTAPRGKMARNQMESRLAVQEEKLQLLETAMLPNIKSEKNKDIISVWDKAEVKK